MRTRLIEKIERSSVIDSGESDMGSIGSKPSSISFGGGCRLERLEEGLEQDGLKQFPSYAGVGGVGGRTSLNGAAAAAANGGGSPAKTFQTSNSRNATFNGTLADADLKQLDEGADEIKICKVMHYLHKRLWKSVNHHHHHDWRCKLLHVIGWAIIFVVAAMLSLIVKIGGEPTLFVMCAATMASIGQLPSREAKVGGVCVGAIATYVVLIKKNYTNGNAAVLTLFYTLECIIAVVIIWRACGQIHPLFDNPRHVVVLAVTSLCTTFLFGVFRSLVILALVEETKSFKTILLDDFSRNWFAVAALYPLVASASITRTYNWITRKPQHPHCTIPKLAMWAAVAITSVGLPVIYKAALRTSSGSVIIECSVMTSFPIMLFAGTLLGIPGFSASAMISIFTLAFVMNGAGIMPSDSKTEVATLIEGESFDSITRIRLWRTIFSLAALFTTVVVAYTLRVLRSVESLVMQQTAVIQSALDDAARARDAERDANQHKAGFLAFLCHELRNPLHAILNMSTFLLEELSAQSSEATQEMDRSAQAIGLASEYMLSLINDTLDMGRFEAGEVHLHRVHVNFRRLLEGTFAWARQLVDGKDVHIVAVVDDSVPMWIIIDPVRSQQIINNLIINAYKFSPPQSSIHIHVSASMLSKSGFTHQIRVAVTDMGPSLTPNQVALLFQPYAIHTSASREYGGSGLGLAITNQISRLMGGRIECEPAVSNSNGTGIGSVFTFILPVTQVDENYLGEQSANGMALAAKSPLNMTDGTLLLAGQKSVDRNVAAHRFDQLTKQLTEQPLGSRTPSPDGLDNRSEQKKMLKINPANGSLTLPLTLPRVAQNAHSSSGSAELLPRLGRRLSPGFYGSDDGNGLPLGASSRKTAATRRRNAGGERSQSPPSTPSAAAGPDSSESPRASFSSFDNFPDSLAREIRARLIDDDGSNDFLQLGSAGGQRRGSHNQRLVGTLPRMPDGGSSSLAVGSAAAVTAAAAAHSASSRINRAHRSPEGSAFALPVTEPKPPPSPIITPPPPPAKASLVPNPANPSSSEIAIMVVDDSGINRRILCRHLSRLTDLPIHQAADGQEAIKTYGAHNAPTYAIIFMDLMMPNVDGHEATRRIRDMGCTAPIVATTASVVPGEEVQAMIHLRECGMSQALPKPFTKEQIEGILKSYGVRLTASDPCLLPVEASARPSSSSSSSAAGPPLLPAPQPVPKIQVVVQQNPEVKTSSEEEKTAQHRKPLHGVKPSSVPARRELAIPSLQAPDLTTIPQPVGGATSFMGLPMQDAVEQLAMQQRGRIRKSQSADNWADMPSRCAIHCAASPQAPPFSYSSNRANTSDIGSHMWGVKNSDAAVSAATTVPPPAATVLLSGESSVSFPNAISASSSPMSSSTSSRPPPPPLPPNSATRIVLNSLPRTSSRPQSEPPRQQVPGAKPYILVVDDSTISRSVLGRILESLGQYEVHDAINGIEALQRCFWTTYSIIFMDLEMPRMGGQEAAARIRATGYMGPIVVITSHSLANLPADVKQAGVTECLAKPIAREVISAVLKRYHLLRTF
ncbi:hypothetical protein HDU86_000856 [Geranomyces michiganensis]|nr:hypothetical protein HDU86_000856 [Geranomyces michiganensis]